ncbi:TlpA family protein disulfide reductase [Dysosmobacter sp.]|uniref:TlpA family protein disulfide reductase n=1 Tax=Dysosmobacter sp. TaxID=2591382 RepID=UPI003AF0AF37
MNAKKILALMLGAMMLLSLAACGAKDNDKQADMSGDGSAMTGEPKTAEEALALHKELLERENAILSENTELWEKVFMEADKGMAMIEDGKNYGDFLLDTVEAAKEQFTDKEYEWLKESATEISNIENKLTELEEKYPEIMQKSMDGDMSMPAGDDMSMPSDQSGTGKMDNQSGADKMAEQGSMQKFPAFEGKDLDGNAVKSDELFSGNAVTVVNFWFTTCNPCVGELAELDALNEELAEKGGSLIGVNTFTLDGDEAAISEAKDVLAKKGATYQNVYFDSDGEAGKFTANIFAYPTTYVIDRNGNIVGEPIVGAITEKKQAETLQKLIEQTLAADMG